MNKPADTQVSTLNGAEAVVEMLKAHGVEVIFGLCGDTSLPLYDALARLPHGMKHVLTRDERHAGTDAGDQLLPHQRAIPIRRSPGIRIRAGLEGVPQRMGRDHR